MGRSDSFLKRGFTAPEAIQYLGIKRAQFELVWRPHLVAMRQGSCVIFDRHEIDALFDRFKEEAREEQEQQPARQLQPAPPPWLPRPSKPRKPVTDAALDFDEVVAQIRERSREARRQARAGTPAPQPKTGRTLRKRPDESSP